MITTMLWRISGDVVRLLVSCQPKGFFKPDSGRYCRIREPDVMVRAECLPVIGFAVMGPPAANRPFLASVAALPSTQPGFHPIMPQHPTARFAHGKTLGKIPFFV